MPKRIFSQVVEESSTKSAIPISKSQPDLVNGIPLSGEDYLLLVRQQANKYAKTTVAPPPKEIKKVQLPSHFQWFNSNQNDTKQEEQALDVWKRGLVGPFRSYQKYMQLHKKTPNRKEIKSKEEGKLLFNSDSEADINIPSSLSQHSILKLLSYHVEWLDEDKFEQQCLFIFSLLVYLDPVLTSQNVSILRDVSRKCIELRSIVENKAPLNIIISIIAEIFGQGDLK
ncbi:hypothetical protein BCV72DRAFT_243578 [Rhizopus microsporus var. microsporus]|uniref:Gem-associated protein 2 n=2 Tax=Rhizopus microsporus TaxID=58291 RepID=A0A2G4SLI6_RHIZD|nr:uncharacterized protein RHIMIDRAFT_245853 [Rhizopus microsporus ATCC 52813]ORE04486.1 hypothetical protein BCV72DRAFT_243578 [Rhizopus microsporus var. microsporus]PHZ09638.1 hypothetical protein RHIMIDRAFT_245853 [Rhizopus microsporus ATCC 52813]